MRFHQAWGLQIHLACIRVVQCHTWRGKLLIEMRYVYHNTPAARSLLCTARGSFSVGSKTANSRRTFNACRELRAYYIFIYLHLCRCFSFAASIQVYMALISTRLMAFIPNLGGRLVYNIQAVKLCCKKTYISYYKFNTIKKLCTRWSKPLSIKYTKEIQVQHVVLIDFNRET